MSYFTLRGTHIITGGTGKYKGITGTEPFACITMPALAGSGRDPRGSALAGKTG
jgi:hypothetical protein